MYAERFVTRTDSNGCLTGLPVFPVDEEVEVIVLRKEKAPRPPVPESLSYRLEPAAMGQPLPGIDLDKALRLADALEDQALAEKL